MWKTKHLKLTRDQRERGVIYSSVLYANNGCKPVLHEVKIYDPDRDRKIEHLKDVSFFKRMAEDCGWDVINEVRS